MTAPLQPITWPHFAEAPKSLQVDPACPECGAVSPQWAVQQPLGETPGSAESGPPQGSGVQMRCARCGCQAVYREKQLAPPKGADAPTSAAVQPVATVMP